MFDNIRADYVLHRPLRNRALWALVVYRFGRWSLQRKFPPWRWLTSKVYGLLNIASQIVTGTIMERGVQIGKGFHIVHPERVRIHSDVVIGDRVGIMHGITIGTNVDGGVPTIGNDVFIGANATIIGRIRVGDGARIAANSLVIANVPPGTVAIGVPAKIMRLPAAKPRTQNQASRLPASPPARNHSPDQPGTGRSAEKSPNRTGEA